MNPEYVVTEEEYFTIWLKIWRRQTTPCPYCRCDNCEHWTGLGWVNPKYGKINERKRRIMEESTDR